MPSNYIQSQTAKLSVALDEFHYLAEKFISESIEEAKKCVLQGASVWATVAQRHTPPDLGKQRFSDTYYQTLELNYVLDKGARTYGLRPIYFLKECVRNPRTRRLKRMFGKLLQQGYQYVVVIHSKSRRTKGVWTYYKPCHSIAEARKYAREDYRGLLRAAWGLGFIPITGKMPPVFNKYISKRPKIKNMTSLSTVVLSPDELTVELTNHAADEGAAYLPGLEVSADLAATRSMNDYMNKFYQQKFAI